MSIKPIKNGPANISSEALLAGCLFVFLFVALLLISSIPSSGQQFSGTISSSGYEPPSGVWVQWCQMGDKPTCKSFQLDQSILWDGQSAEGKFGRYAGGDRSVQGFSTVPAVSGEAKGGEIEAAMIFLYASKGINRPITPQNLFDFAFANPCSGFLCGCSWYERITGAKHPIDPGCANEATNTAGNLRPCPAEPLGCGRNKNNPCITADTDIPTDKAKQVPCLSGSGRVGRWLKRVEGGDAGEKPPDKPVDQTPIKPADPTPPTPVQPQPVNLICLILKIDPTTKATTIEQCK